jgi:hypothetical protein
LDGRFRDCSRNIGIVLLTHCGEIELVSGVDEHSGS